MLKKYELYCKASTVAEDLFEYSVCCPDDVYKISKLLGMLELPYEKVYAMCLDSAGNINGVFEVSSGGTASSLIDPKRVFSTALLVAKTTALVMCHNHPSGNTSPSTEDIDITKKLIGGGNILGIAIIDHVIVGERGYYSMREHGYIS